VAVEVFDAPESATPERRAGQVGSRPVLAVDDDWGVGFCGHRAPCDDRPERHVNRPRDVARGELTLGSNIQDHGGSVRIQPGE
jgi:hypothetical protein